MTTQQRIEIALRAGMVAYAALEFTKSPYGSTELFPLLFQQLEKEVSGLKAVVKQALEKQAK